MTLELAGGVLSAGACGGGVLAGCVAAGLLLDQFVAHAFTLSGTPATPVMNQAIVQSGVVGEQGADLIVGGAAGGTATGQGAFSRILGFTERSLQKGFTKHGTDFGLIGSWNPTRAAEFSRAVNQHVNSVRVVAVNGTYRGMPVTHYLNPSTSLNVIVDQAGNYISGWRLGPGQLKSVLSTGRLY